MHYSKTSWMCRALFAVMFVCVLFSFQDASAQRIALKTNALEYLTVSPNITMEARLSRKMSLQVGLAGCPDTRPMGNYKFTNYRIEPELRYWFNRPMAKHFVALSTTAGTYSLMFKDRYISGDMIAAGISYGYALVLGRHWNVEFELGVGVGSFKGYDYKGEDNKPAEKNMNKVLPVPIRAAVSFAYVFK
ncbi:MAG: DUF3575 domain-containing protein [Muribaculaceae bacterium]|nr:DUF3575 domain-containing protein [Muribaculaceae bacterium]